MHLANGLQAAVATTAEQTQRVVIDAAGFRSFTDVLLPDDARSVAALLAKAIVIPPGPVSYTHLTLPTILRV